MIFQQNRKAKHAIENTDNKNPFLCQEKNKDFFPSLEILPLFLFLRFGLLRCLLRLRMLHAA